MSSGIRSPYRVNLPTKSTSGHLSDFEVEASQSVPLLWCSTLLLMNLPADVYRRGYTLYMSLTATAGRAAGDIGRDAKPAYDS